MKRPKPLVFCLIPLIGLIACTALYAEVCNRIVAVVNDDVITLYELNQKIEQLTGQKITDLENQNDEAFFQARRNILDLLVDEKLIQAKAKETGYEATLSETDTTIERIKTANHWTQEDLVAAVQGQGYNFDEFRMKIKNDMDKNRFIDLEIKSKIVISDEAVKKYYEEHADENKTYDKVRLAIIAFSNDTPSAQEKVNMILERLKNGDDFGDLAKQYSQGPNAKGGGDLGLIKTSQLDPNLKKMVENMTAGEITQPIITHSGVQIIKLVEKKEEGVKSLEEAKDAIYDTLYKAEFEQRFATKMKELREKSYIKIIF